MQERYDLTLLSLNFHLVLLQVLLISGMKELMTLLNARKESRGNSAERGVESAISTYQTQNTMLYGLESVGQSQRLFDTKIHFSD